jgi:hypothetical protein
LPGQEKVDAFARDLACQDVSCGGTDVKAILMTRLLHSGSLPNANARYAVALSGTRITIYLDNEVLEAFRARADAAGRG